MQSHFESKCIPFLRRLWRIKVRYSKRGKQTTVWWKQSKRCQCEGTIGSEAAVWEVAHDVQRAELKCVQLVTVISVWPWTKPLLDLQGVTMVTTLKTLQRKLRSAWFCYPCDFFFFIRFIKLKQISHQNIPKQKSVLWVDLFDTSIWSSTITKDERCRPICVICLWYKLHHTDSCWHYSGKLFSSLWSFESYSRPSNLYVLVFLSFCSGKSLVLDLILLLSLTDAVSGRCNTS